MGGKSNWVLEPSINLTVHKQQPALGSNSGHELSAMEQAARGLPWWQRRSAEIGSLVLVGSWPLHVGPGLGPKTLANRGAAEVASWGEKINGRAWLL